MLVAVGKARIQHADTGVVYEIDATSLEFEIDDTDERGRGFELVYTAIFNHPQLGELIWKGWDDSVRDVMTDYYNASSHKLLEDFNFRLDDYDKVDAMAKWFYENYEDPQNSPPHDSKEGDYEEELYDAGDVLAEKFPEALEDIESVAEHLESDGVTLWRRISHNGLTEIDKALNTLIDYAPEPKTDPAFILGDDGVFHITPPPDNQPVDSQDDFLDELRMVIDDLLESFKGANLHLELIPIIERYKEAISGNQISISRLYARGIRLDNAVQIIKARIESEGLQLLGRDIESNLDSALELHRTYIMSDVEGRRLVHAAAAYRQSPEQIEKLKKASKQLADNIAGNHELFGDDVRTHVPDVLTDIEKGHHPERSNQSAENTLTNMISGILQWIKRTSTRAIYDIIIDQAAEGFNEAVKSVLEESTTPISKIKKLAVSAIFLFLMKIAPLLQIIAPLLAGELSWLASAAHLLERIRLKIKSD